MTRSTTNPLPLDAAARPLDLDAQVVKARRMLRLDPLAMQTREYVDSLLDVLITERTALLASVRGAEAETRDAERWRFARDHSAWHRYVDDDDVEQTYMMVRTLRGADLSCPAMRDYAIGALRDAARAHPPTQETDDAECDPE